MAYEELKQKQSAMWGNGPYQRITETLTDIHDLVIERLAPEPGDRWLDLACGTGAISERAAGRRRECHRHRPRTRPDRDREGASRRARARDRLPGRRRREPRPPRRRLRQGLVHRRDHVRARSRGGRARARARHARRGGRIALANWTPTGGLGDCSRSWRRISRRRRRAARSTGATKARCASCSVTRFELEIEERVSPLRIASGEDYWDLFSTSYGPTKTAARTRSATAAEDLHRDWVEFFETNYKSNGEIVHTREYLLVQGTRR